jgi:hypothetical protein
MGKGGEGGEEKKVKEWKGGDRRKGRSVRSLVISQFNHWFKQLNNGVLE